MPVYEYECEKCRKVHEQLQKFTDPPMKKCPDCGGPVDKLLSQSSFSLKGSGWYTTDYKSNGKGSQQKRGDGASEKVPEKAKDASETPPTKTPASESKSKGSTS